jgi:UDP-N-acetylglucosamine/UDP-N-acetylgalactosamine 4-epimerase
MFSNYNILLTGGAGFIGSNITEYLIKEKVKKLVIIDNLSTGHYKNIENFINKYNNIEFIEGDIKNIDLLKKITKNIDMICHQAALGSVPRSIKDPLSSHKSNVDGFLNLLIAANENKVKRIVYASSSSVYGDSEILPKVEEKVGNLLSPYAGTKKICEIYGSIFTKCYGLECIGLRYFNVYGPKQDPNGQYAAVIPKFIDLVKNDKSPTINGDGSYSRDFTFVKNVVKANCLAMLTQNKECFGEAFNVGAGERITILELFNTINQNLGKNLKPVFGEIRDGDIPHSFSDYSKAKNYFNYTPDVLFNEGIKKTINYYTSQKKNIVQSLWIGNSLSKLEIMCINSYLKNGYEFHLYTYDYIDNVPKGTIIKDGNEILDSSEIFTYKNKSYSAVSNLFRFMMIYKKGNYWVDTDAVSTKFYDNDDDIIIGETDKSYTQKKIGCSIVRFKKEDKKLLDAIELCKKGREDILNGNLVWGLGPRTTKTLVEKYNLHDKVKKWNFSSSCNNKHYRTIIDKDYLPKVENNEKYFNDISKIPKENYFIHLWNEFWRRDKLDKNETFRKDCLFEQLKDKYYPKEIQLRPKYIRNKEKCKICVTAKIRNSSFGGGNQFLQNFVDYMERNNYDVVFDLLSDDIDVIFVMDPRILTLNKIDCKQVYEYKLSHPEVLVVHRVNDCDKPRGNVDKLDKIMKEMFKVDDFVFFVSQWTCRYFLEQEFRGEHTSINNGCNTKIFYPDDKKLFNKNKIKIVTHHWSTNWNKGFDIYNKLAEYCKNNKNVELTYIGREFKYSKDGDDNKDKKEVRVIGPLSGMELGDELRKHDIYITASKFENCPMHVVEAISSGLPILYNRDLGGGVELCVNQGEDYSSFDELLNKLNKIINNYEKYRNSLDYNRFSSDNCNRKYKEVIEKLLNNRINMRKLSLAPNWINKTVKWMKEIEHNDYVWSLKGFDSHKLSAASLFGKLATIYKKYHTFNKEKIKYNIEKFVTHDGLYKDIEKEIISESRQAISGLINLGYEPKKCNVDKYFTKPLYFMGDEKWKNPWAAGAHLSHYLFFCKLNNRQDLIDNVLKDLDKYKKHNGWYFGSPKTKIVINGIMKVFTGFDIINKEVEEQMGRNIIDFLLENNDSRGGCGIYDYIYVMTKCMDVTKDYRLDECKKVLYGLYVFCKDHQQEDGGFKYHHDTDAAHKYYGQNITPNGMLGNIHSTTLFSMALSRLDHYLELDLGLELAIS